VADIRAFAAEADEGLEFYYPYAQYPAFNLFYVIRTAADPQPLMQTVRRVIQEAEPSIAVSTIKTMHQRIDESLWQTRLWGWLFGMFATVALLLAAAGLYGLVSYLVARRSKEMGIRLCMGATGTQIARLILGGMCRLVVGGIAVGVFAAFAASRLLATLLFRVSATDPTLYIGVSATVAVVALVACCPPILRSRRINVVSILYED
jgi:ABC-type antimicrobial peptide transport system permease subunit